MIKNSTQVRFKQSRLRHDKENCESQQSYIHHMQENQNKTKTQTSHDTYLFEILTNVEKISIGIFKQLLNRRR